jgi:hypothetical protein
MSAVPETYKDSLAARTFPHRFRRVGNPYAFLNDVGIVPILEYIYKGNLLIDVAEALNVSFTILTTWAENEGHSEAIEEAQRISAEGYLAEGMRRLRDAGTDFELKRAKEMINHARFMAAKKDKSVYGSNEQQAGAEKAGVSYVFNIAGNVVAHSAPTVEAAAEPPSNIIEGESKPVTMDILGHLERDFADVFGVPEAPAKPVTLPAPSAKRGPTQPKVVKVPLPLIGPFHD